MTQAIPPGFPRSNEDWESRLREAAYNSPSGTRIEFSYEDVARNVPLRGTPWEFPGVDGAYVQKTGFGARKYPLRCIFAGPQHDLIATAFEAALLEPGIGRLEHPLYGSIPNVVPFGDIGRRDDLKTAANQTILEVTFWTTLPSPYPLSQRHPRSEILDAIEGFDVAAAQAFASRVNLGNALNRAAQTATTRSFLDGISESLSSISGAVASVSGAFADLNEQINTGIDVLVGQPLLLALQVKNLIRAPARALIGIRSRLDAYGDLFDDIFGSRAGNPSKQLAHGVGLANRTDRIANDFITADLVASSALSAEIVALNSQPIDDAGRPVAGPLFTTRPEALDAGATLGDHFDAFVEWREAGYDALGDVDGVHPYQVDDGAAYQRLQQAVALTLGNIVSISFELLPERSVVLDRARTIIDLSAELYGSVDDRLDFLISSNNLVGDEILELPKGKRIVYYA